MLMHHHLLFGRGPRLLGGPVFLLLAVMSPAGSRTSARPIATR